MIDPDGPTRPDIFAGPTLDLGAIAERVFPACRRSLSASARRGTRPRMSPTTPGDASEFALCGARATAREDQPECPEIGHAARCLARRNCIFALPPKCPHAPAGRERELGAEWRILSPHRSTSWAAITGRAWCLPGADIALIRRPDLRFRLFGDEKVVRPLLDRYPAGRARPRSSSIATIAVRMDDKPSQALRHGRRKSSACGGRSRP